MYFIAKVIIFWIRVIKLVNPHGLSLVPVHGTSEFCACTKLGTKRKIPNINTGSIKAKNFLYILIFYCKDTFSLLLALEIES